MSYANGGLPEDTLDEQVETLWTRTKRKAKQLAREAVATAVMLPFFLTPLSGSISPGVTYEQVKVEGNINFMSSERRDFTVGFGADLIARLDSGELTPYKIIAPLTRMRHLKQEKYEVAEDGTLLYDATRDPKFIRMDDLYEFASNVLFDKFYYEDNGIKRGDWNPLDVWRSDVRKFNMYFSKDFPKGASDELIGWHQLGGAFWAVAEEASRLYVQNPNRDFRSIALEATRNVDYESIAPIIDWDHIRFATGEEDSVGDGRFNGDYMAYFLKYPAEAIDRFLRESPELFEEKREYLYARDYSWTASGAYDLYMVLIKTPEVLDEIVAKSREHGVDPARVNLLCANSKLNSVETESTPASMTVKHEMPFRDEEEEQSEEDKLLKDLIRGSFEAQKREGRSVIDMPSAAIWHPSVVSIYKHVRDHEEDYRQGHVRKQIKAIEQTFADQQFYAVLPDEFTVVGLGCSDEPNERKLIEQALLQGKSIEQFVFVDMDKTAYANAISNIQEGVKVRTSREIDGVGFPAEINGESLEAIKEDPGVDTTRPLVYMAEGLVNFDGHMNDERTFYREVIGALRQGDRVIVAKPLENDHENESTYYSSIMIGEPMLALAELEAKKWSFDRIHYDRERKQYTIEYRCYETDKEFDAGDTLRFLHSSRNSILDILSEEIIKGEVNITYRNPAAEAAGYEVVVLERVADEVRK